MPARRRRRPPWYRDRRWIIAGLLVFGGGVYLVTRTEPPPRDPGDLCAIFEEKRSWYKSARRSYEAWGVPEAVQLAVIRQESAFRARARPPRRWIWRIIPGPRPSSAYGYAQVIDSTWEEFQKSTGRKGNRRDFDDVSQFIGWYGDQIHRSTGIAKDDAYNLYLAYHEGPAGYRRGTHQRKKWLLGVAEKVDRRARKYQDQYDVCAESLRRPWEWLFWPAVAALAVLAVRLWRQWQARPRQDRSKRRRRRRLR